MNLFKKKEYPLSIEDKDNLKKIRSSLFLLSSITIIICLIGLSMNILVVKNNNEKMPVLTTYTVNDDNHFAFQNFNEVQYPYLSDIIELKNPTKYQVMISIGDVLLISAVILGLYNAGYFTIKSIKFKRGLKKNNINNIIKI